MSYEQTLTVNERLAIPLAEIELQPIRAQGAGGQNVNKVSSAIHLRFDLNTASLPETVRQRLLALNDQRISKDGVVVIKAQQFRTQEQNREEALRRLAELLRTALIERKPRRATRPTRAVVRRRVDSKVRRGHLKTLRRPPDD